MRVTPYAAVLSCAGLAAAFASELPAQATQFVDRVVVNPAPLPGVPLVLVANSLAGDVDNNGYPDLVINENRWNGLVLDPGLASPAQFQNRMLIASTSSNALAPFLVDLDVDGNLDLVVRAAAGGSLAAQVAYGNGDGTFQAFAVWQNLTVSTLPAWADVTGDGRPDMVGTSGNCVATVPFTGTMGEIYVNNPSGPPIHHALTFTFGGGSRSGFQTYGAGEQGIAIGDVTDDGVNDMVFFRGMNSFPFAVEFVAGSTTGTFSAPQVISSGWGVGGMVLMAHGDLDGDGRMDVFGSADGEYVVCYGHPVSVLEPPVPVPIDIPSGYAHWSGAHLADFDSDGYKDILLSVNSGFPPPASSRMLLKRGLGNRMFSPHQHLDWMTTQADGVRMQQSAVADFDLDGDADIFFADDIYSPTDPQQLFLLENRTRFGEGCAGVFGIPASFAGTASPGNLSMEFGLSGAAPSSVALALMSTTPGASSAGCTLLIDPASLVLPTGPFGIVGTDAVGNAALQFPLPGVVEIVGLGLVSQWAVQDPNGGFVPSTTAFSLSGGRTTVIY